MNRLFSNIITIISCLSLVILLQSCGGEVSSNQYLGKLPGIAKKYSQEIESTKKELKESKDMNEAFGLQKELDNLKDESENAVKEYIANNNLESIPFEMKTDHPFTIKDIKIDPKNHRISSLDLVASVKFNKNLTANDIREMYGGFGSTINAYAQVIDSKGTPLHNTVFQIKIPYSQNEFRAKEGVEYTMKGTIFKLAELENFAKINFISKDEYNKKS